MIARHTQGWPLGPARDVSSELDRIVRDLGRLVESPRLSRISDISAGVYPLVNVSQDSENFYVRSEIPGVKLEDLDVSIMGRSVTISGERRVEIEDPKVSYHRRERQGGKFRRQITLPTDLDADKIRAQYKHGILMLVLPKADNAKPKKVSISE